MAVREFEGKTLPGILELQRQLLADQYKPLAVRGVQIPKQNGEMEFK